MGKSWYVTILTVFVVVVFAYHSPTVAESCAINATWVSVVGTPDNVSFSEKLPSTSTYIPLVRANNANLAPSGFQANQYWEITQTYQTATPCTPISAKFRWKRENTNSGAGRIETSDDGMTWTIRASNSIALNTSASFTQEITWTNTTNVSYRYIRMAAGSSAPRILTMYIDSEDVFTPLIRPVTNGDEISLTMPQDPPYYANYVMTVSDEAGRPVHAPIDSTVMGITKLTAEHCDMLGLYECYANEYPIDISRAYLVSLRTTDGAELLYIVDNAPNYLQLEANITGGCVMGQTTRTNSDVGLAVATDGTEDLLTRFTLAPSDEAEPCVSGETNLVCEGGESRLNTIFIASQKSAGVVMDGSAIIVPPGGRMHGLLALPMNERVYIEVVAGGESAIVQFGTRVENVAFTEQLNVIVFGWSYVVPDVGNNSTVSLTNTGSIPLTISDICVAFESKNDPDDPDNPNPPPLPPQPTSCYFFNPSFDLGDSGWQINATDYNTPTGQGLLSIAEGGQIAQHVQLYVGDLPITTYVLTLEVGLWYDLPYVPSQTGDDMEFFVTLDPIPLDEFAVVTALDFYKAIANNETITLTTELPLEVAFDTNLVIGVGYFGAVPVDGLLGVHIYSACLEPSDGIWHGYEPGENDLNGNGWLDEHCDQPAKFQTTGDVAETVVGLGNFIYASLKEFVGCQLIRATNGIYAQVRNTGLMGKYTGDWIGGELMPYIGGYLGNMFTFGSGGLDPNSLLNAFNLFNNVPTNIFELGLWVVANFFTMIGRVLTNLGTIVQAIIDFFRTLINIGNELTRAWTETTAQTMPGIDDCQFSPETKSRCVMFWIMENTLLGEPYGTLIIPVMVSALTIVILGWLYIKVRELIGRVVSMI